MLKNRWNYVYKLWRSYLSHDPLPQFDKWLAKEFTRYPKFGKRDRKWYSEILFAGMRFGYFSLFCEEFFQKMQASSNSTDVLTPGVGVLSSAADLSSPGLTGGAIADFTKKHSSIETILEAIKNLSAERFFIWVSLRYIAVDFNLINKDALHLNSENSLQEKEFFDFIFSAIHKEENVSFQLLYHSIPDFYHDLFTVRIQHSNWNKKNCQDFLQALDYRPPLWLRLNDKKYLADVLLEFEKAGLQVEVCNQSLKVSGDKGILDLVSYRSGFFEIQDFASQQIGEHVKAKPGQFVWDACAGGGGKTLQLASYLNNKGAVYASDIRAYKLDEVKKRASKAGFFNVRCITWDGEKLPLFPKEIENKNGFDWVLVDAPCSSTGTWRRSPDAKYRFREEEIKNLLKLQFSLLKNAGVAVKDGGHLVYSTCSWTCIENEDIVRQFLLEHSNFSLLEQNLLGSPAENSDTMFVAVLKKSP